MTQNHCYTSKQRGKRLTKMRFVPFHVNVPEAELTDPAPAPSADPVTRQGNRHRLFAGAYRSRPSSRF